MGFVGFQRVGFICHQQWGFPASIWLWSNAKIILFLIIFTLITEWLITPIERDDKQISCKGRGIKREVRERNRKGGEGDERGRERSTGFFF
jgi:hypothetical protein